MSFSVGSLANYTNEQSTDLLVKALFGSKTSSTLQSANQVQVGVKSASALNILASTVFFQADGCGYNPSGTTAFTQRNITVGAVKVEETLCPKTLEAKWMQTQIMPGSPTMIPFEEQVGAEKAAVIAQTLEVAMWQGDTTSGNPNLSRFDGFNKIIAAASPVLANSAPTTFTSITAANIDDVLNNETGAVIRMRAPGMVQPFNTPFVGQAAFPMLDYVDQIKEDRTGMSKAAMGLNADALQSSTKAAVAATAAFVLDCKASAFKPIAALLMPVRSSLIWST